MSSFIDKSIRESKRIGHQLTGSTFKTPKVVLPKAPTIDEAGKNRDEFDRIRRRRGVLATIFSNNASSTPSVATSTLLGQ